MTVFVAFLAALVGALAVVTSGILLEDYKRHRDRQGAASALAGEICSILHMTEQRQYVQAFQGFLARLEAGQQVSVFDIGVTPGKLDPVIEKYIDRLGLLDADLPERIAIFYMQLNGIRLDIANLAAGRWDRDIARKAALIREDLRLWDETASLGQAVLVGNFIRAGKKRRIG